MGPALTLTAVLAAPAGAPLWRVTLTGDDPEALGRAAARALWDAGASSIDGLCEPT